MFDAKKIGNLFRFFLHKIDFFLIPEITRKIDNIAGVKKKFRVYKK